MDILLALLVFLISFSLWNFWVGAFLTLLFTVLMYSINTLTLRRKLIAYIAALDAVTSATKALMENKISEKDLYETVSENLESQDLPEKSLLEIKGHLAGILPLFGTWTILKKREHQEGTHIS